MKYSKYRIAEELGISPQAVYLWYSGQSFPSSKHLIALSKLLHMSVEEVLADFKKSASMKEKQPKKMT